MTLKILLVEADDDNHMEELLHEGNFYTIDTEMDSMEDFIEATIKISMQLPDLFTSTIVKLQPHKDVGIQEVAREHLEI